MKRVEMRNVGCAVEKKLVSEKVVSLGGGIWGGKIGVLYVHPSTYTNDEFKIKTDYCKFLLI